MKKIKGKQIELYTDSAFILESDVLIPSQKATKSYVRSKIAITPDWNEPSTEKAPTVNAVKEYVNASLGNATTSGYLSMSDVTYQEIKTLIANSGLKVGSFYKLTDYRTKHIIPNTNELHTAPVEQIILFANTATTFNNIAYSTTYANDYIEYDFSNNLCEDETTPRTGFISRRIDTVMNLETPYDFRGVKFRRWEADTSAIAWNSTVVYNKKDVVYYTDGYLYISMVDDNGGVFNTAKWGKLMNYTGYVLTTDSVFTTVGNTVIAPATSYIDVLTFGAGCAEILVSKTTNGLNNITFGVDCEDIVIAPDCESLIFSDNCYHINLGAIVVDNHFYHSSNIRIGGGSYSNLFASNSKITLAMECSNNTFCEYTNDIECGSGSESLVLYNASEDIKFGNNCSNIIIAGVSSKLSFPAMFQNKTFANGINGMTFVLQDTATKTYTISGTHNVLVDMKSPDGQMWYRTIDNYGSLSVQNLY
jgi:hypothetical protein